MRRIMKAFGIAVAGGAVVFGLAAAPAQAPIKLTLFGQPSVNNNSIWMALDKGFYQQEGLRHHVPAVSLGHHGVPAFQTGQGDIVMTGDLPSVQYFFRANGDYRTIAVIERDAKGYVAVAGNDIKTPQDLVGKTIATRVGSTGSWFISEYLTKNHVDPKTVTVKNLDTQVLPAALCGGEIAAFFIWQPVGSRTMEICPDKAHLPQRRDRLYPGLPGRRRTAGVAGNAARQGHRDALVARDHQRPGRRRTGFQSGRRLRRGQAQPEREGDQRPMGYQHPADGDRQSLLFGLLQSQPLGPGRKANRRQD